MYQKLSLDVWQQSLGPSLTTFFHCRCKIFYSVKPRDSTLGWILSNDFWWIPTVFWNINKRQQKTTPVCPAFDWKLHGLGRNVYWLDWKKCWDWIFPLKFKTVRWRNQRGFSIKIYKNGVELWMIPQDLNFCPWSDAEKYRPHTNCLKKKLGITTLGFWGFRGSLALHLVGKYIIPGDPNRSPQCHRVDKHQDHFDQVANQAPKELANLLPSLKLAVCPWK